MYFIDDLAILFSDFYEILKTIKNVEKFNEDFYQLLREKFYAIWKVKLFFNNHDYPKNIFSRGRRITKIIHFRTSSQLVLIGQFLNKKKNKIYKIIKNLCTKIKKFVVDKENSTKL